MAIRIKQLRCRVTVQGEDAKPLLHRDARPAKPAMSFTLVKPLTRNSNMQEPAETATEERGAAAGNDASPSLRQVDTKEVADRVYELMQREIMLARERGGLQRKG